MEIKKIEGYDNYYVTDSGKVMSTNGNDLKWLKQITDKDGYKEVHLCKDGKPHTKKVHRLVAEAFIPNPEGKPCIDHINGDRTDNRVKSGFENLRWCTHKENSNNPVTRKRNSEAKKGDKHPMYGKPRPEGSGKPPKSVEQWTKDGMTLIAVYASTHEAERQTGCHNISKCCLGKLKTTGGYIWQYQ